MIKYTTLAALTVAGVIGCGDGDSPNAQSGTKPKLGAVEGQPDSGIISDKPADFSDLRGDYLLAGGEVLFSIEGPIVTVQNQDFKFLAVIDEKDRTEIYFGHIDMGRPKDLILLHTEVENEFLVDSNLPGLEGKDRVSRIVHP